MQYVSPKNWTNLEQTRGLLFFAQRISELSFPYTADVYKAPSLSISGLISDAIQVLGRDWGDDSKQKQASHIIDEIKHRCNLVEFLPDVLHMPLAEYFHSDQNDSKLTTIKLKTLLAEINESSYLAAIADRVVALSTQANKKKTLDALAVELVSTLQYLGVSRDYINQYSMDAFFGEKPVKDGKIIFSLIKDLYPHRHDFDVYCIASEGIKLFGDESLRSFRIKVADELPEYIELDYKKFNKLTKKTGFAVFCVKVDATDYNSAANSAKAMLDRLASVYQLFHHKWTYEVLPVAISNQTCCSKVHKEAQVHGNAMHYIKDQLPDRARASLSEMLSNRAFMRGPDRSKYVNLIEMHGLSARTLSADSQLINVWTCLETISPPSSHSSSNIDRVVNCIIPVLSLRYTKRILVYLLFDLFRWNKAKVLKAFKLYGVLKSLKAHMKLFEVISNKNNQAGLIYLLEELGDFELLRFRLYSVSYMFSSATNVRDAIRNYENTVRWTIHRIYRTRNSIVHNGTSPKYSRYLVEDSHNYFDQCFEFCMNLSSTSRKFNTFQVCFGFASMQHNFYINSLSSEKYLENCIWDIKSRNGKSYIFESAYPNQ